MGQFFTPFDTDGRERIATQTDTLGLTLAFNYDAMGQLTKIIDPSGNDVEYVYGAGR